MKLFKCVKTVLIIFSSSYNFLCPLSWNSQEFQNFVNAKKYQKCWNMVCDFSSELQNGEVLKSTPISTITSFRSDVKKQLKTVHPVFLLLYAYILNQNAKSSHDPIKILRKSFRYFLFGLMRLEMDKACFIDDPYTKIDNDTNDPVIIAMDLFKAKFKQNITLKTLCKDISRNEIAWLDNKYSTLDLENMNEPYWISGYKRNYNGWQQIVEINENDKKMFLQKDQWIKNRKEAAKIFIKSIDYFIANFSRM